MKKSLQLIKREFESSSTRTPQYLECHKTFKREFTALLKPHVKRIEMFKPNHFDLGGFFEMNNGKIFYFSISDLRWSKDNMLIRTAEHFKDYTGGRNQFVKLDDQFEASLFRIINFSWGGN